MVGSSSVRYPRIRVPRPIAATISSGEVTLLELGLDGVVIEHASSLWAGRRISMSVATRNGRLDLDDVRVLRSRITPAPNRAVRYVSEIGFEARHRENPLLRTMLVELIQPEIQAAVADRRTRRVG